MQDTLPLSQPYAASGSGGSGGSGVGFGGAQIGLAPVSALELLATSTSDPLAAFLGGRAVPVGGQGEAGASGSSGSGSSGSALSRVPPTVAGVMLASARNASTAAAASLKAGGASPAPGSEGSSGSGSGSGSSGSGSAEPSALPFFSLVDAVASLSAVVSGPASRSYPSASTTSSQLPPLPHALHTPSSVHGTPTAVDAMLEWVQGTLEVCAGGVVASSSVSGAAVASSAPAAAGSPPPAPRLHFVRCIRIPTPPSQMMVTLGTGAPTAAGAAAAAPHPAASSFGTVRVPSTTKPWLAGASSATFTSAIPSSSAQPPAAAAATTTPTPTTTPTFTLSSGTALEAATRQLTIAGVLPLALLSAFGLPLSIPSQEFYARYVLTAPAVLTAHGAQLPRPPTSPAAREALSALADAIWGRHVAPSRHTRLTVRAYSSSAITNSISVGGSGGGGSGGGGGGGAGEDPAPALRGNKAASPKRRTVPLRQQAAAAAAAAPSSDASLDAFGLEELAAAAGGGKASTSMRVRSLSPVRFGDWEGGPTSSSREAAISAAGATLTATAATPAFAAAGTASVSASATPRGRSSTTRGGSSSSSKQGGMASPATTTYSYAHSDEASMASLLHQQQQPPQAQVYHTQASPEDAASGALQTPLEVWCKDTLTAAAAACRERLAASNARLARYTHFNAASSNYPPPAPGTPSAAAAAAAAAATSSSSSRSGGPLSLYLLHDSMSATTDGYESPIPFAAAAAALTTAALKSALAAHGRTPGSSASSSSASSSSSSSAPSTLGGELLPPPPPLALGITSVLLSTPLLTALEAARTVEILGMDYASGRITALLRAWRHRCAFLRFRAASTLLAAAWRGRCIRLAYARHCAAALRVKCYLRTAVAFRRLQAQRASIRAIQRAWRASQSKARARRMCARMRALTLLARGFCVRATVARWSSAAHTLQRAIQAWLGRLRRLKGYVRSVVALQSAARGRAVRGALAPHLHPLHALQRAHRLSALVRRTVALSKGRRIRASWCLLKAACSVLGGWWRGTLVRRAFCAVRGAVALLQGCVRGMLARRAVARLRAARANSLNSLALLRLRRVEGEVLSVALLGGEGGEQQGGGGSVYQPGGEEGEGGQQQQLEGAGSALVSLSHVPQLDASGAAGSSSAATAAASGAPPPWGLRLVDMDVHHPTAELYYYSTARNSRWSGRGVDSSLLAAAAHLEEHSGPGAASAILPVPRLTFVRSWSVSFSELPAIAYSAAEKAVERGLAGERSAGAHDPALSSTVIGSASPGGGVSPLAALLPGGGEEGGSGAAAAAAAAAWAPPALASVALGTSHSLAVDDAGRVYSWGWGERGALGHPLPGNTAFASASSSSTPTSASSTLLHGSPSLPCPALKRPSLVSALSLSSPVALVALHPGPWTFFPPLGPGAEGVAVPLPHTQLNDGQATFVRLAHPHGEARQRLCALMSSVVTAAVCAPLNAAQAAQAAATGSGGRTMSSALATSLATAASSTARAMRLSAAQAIGASGGSGGGGGGGGGSGGLGAGLHPAQPPANSTQAAAAALQVLLPLLRRALPFNPIPCVQLAAGRDFSLARAASGLVYGWGANGRGQLGVGPRSPAYLPHPTLLLPLAAMSLGLSGLPATPSETCEVARGGAGGSVVSFSPFAVGSPGRFPGAPSAGSRSAATLPGGFTLHVVSAEPSSSGRDEGAEVAPGEMIDAPSSYTHPVEAQAGGSGSGSSSSSSSGARQQQRAATSSDLLAMAVVSPCTNLAAGDAHSVFVLGGVAGGLALVCGAAEACGQSSSFAAHAGLPASHWDVDKALAAPSTQALPANFALSRHQAQHQAQHRPFSSAELDMLQPVPVWISTGLSARRAAAVVSAAAAAGGAGGAGGGGGPKGASEHWVLLRDVTSLAAGRGHTVVALRDGSAWTWGDNGSGQCGVVNRKRPHRVLFPAPPAQTLAAVAAEAAAAAATAASRCLPYPPVVWAPVAVPPPEAPGAVLEAEAWRPTRKAAAAAAAAGAPRAPSPFLSLRPIRYTGVAAGSAHTLLLTSEGHCAARGSNECGQIGLGKGALAVGSVARPLWVAVPPLPWSLGVSPEAAPPVVLSVAAAGQSSFALVGVRAGAGAGKRSAGVATGTGTGASNVSEGLWGGEAPPPLYSGLPFGPRAVAQWGRVGVVTESRSGVSAASAAAAAATSASPFTASGSMRRPPPKASARGFPMPSGLPTLLSPTLLLPKGLMQQYRAAVAASLSPRKAAAAAAAAGGLVPTPPLPAPIATLLATGHATVTVSCVAGPTPEQLAAHLSAEEFAAHHAHYGGVPYVPGYAGPALGLSARAASASALVAAAGRRGGAGALLPPRGAVPSLRDYLKPFSHSSSSSSSGWRGVGAAATAGAGARTAASPLPPPSGAAVAAAAAATAAATAASSRTGRDSLLITVLPPTAAKLMAKASPAQLRTWERERGGGRGGGVVVTGAAAAAAGGAVSAQAQAQAQRAEGRGAHYWSL